MGYDNFFWGEITFTKKLAYLKCKQMLEADKRPFDLHDITTDDKKMEFSFQTELSNYDNDIEKACYFIALLDNEATGEIFCDGEDRDDKWKIEISDGQVYIYKGHLVYEGDGSFQDKETKLEVYKLTKDKKLRDDVLIGEL